ncbi:MAG TPA: hypothetical protein VF331_07885 [Polyangiales bacterium]
MTTGWTKVGKVPATGVEGLVLLTDGSVLLFTPVPSRSCCAVQRYLPDAQGHYETGVLQTLRPLDMLPHTAAVLRTGDVLLIGESGGQAAVEFYRWRTRSFSVGKTADLLKALRGTTPNHSCVFSQSTSAKTPTGHVIEESVVLIGAVGPRTAGKPAFSRTLVFHSVSGNVEVWSDELDREHGPWMMCPSLGWSGSDADNVLSIAIDSSGALSALKCSIDSKQWQPAPSFDSVAQASKGALCAGLLMPDARMLVEPGASAAVLLPSGVPLFLIPDGANHALVDEGRGSRLTQAIKKRCCPMIVLPSGQVLAALDGGLYLGESGPPEPRWRPHIVHPVGTWDDPAWLQGTRFGGVSQANCNLDPNGYSFTAPTNVPIVRLTNTVTGDVVYCPTYENPRSTGTSLYRADPESGLVAADTGDNTGTEHFDDLYDLSYELPTPFAEGDYKIEVVVNGIASDPPITAQLPGRYDFHVTVPRGTFQKVLLGLADGPFVATPGIFGGHPLPPDPVDPTLGKLTRQIKTAEQVILKALAQLAKTQHTLERKNAELTKKLQKQAIGEARRPAAGKGSAARPKAAGKRAAKSRKRRPR